MSDQYVGEIRIFAGSYAPVGWALCNGQILTIQGNDKLYAVLGTTYGGDGVNTFALPDLRGRIPMDQGAGPGLSNRLLGTQSGTEKEGINLNQLPTHNHLFYASNQGATSLTLSGRILAKTPPDDFFYAPESTTTPPLEVNLMDTVIGNTGGGQLHDNRMPFMALSFIIALDGYFPQRQN